MLNSPTTFALATELGQLLLKKHWQCTVAESCTGGGLAAAITDCPGSSQWFEQGFITYSNAAKQALLNVPDKTLTQFGAVSEQTVSAMAEGALAVSHASISVAISGIAGPGGGSVTKPVGTVWIGWAIQHHPTHTQHFLFQGNRLEIRQQAVNAALQGIIELLDP